MSRQDRRSGTASRTVRMTSGDSSTFSTVTTAPRFDAARTRSANHDAFVSGEIRGADLASMKCALKTWIPTGSSTSMKPTNRARSAWWKCDGGRWAVNRGRPLAAPPGPVNAIIASQTVARSWRAGFLVGMGATTADTIFLAVSVVAHSAVASIQGWVPIIALLGAGVMAYFAWNTVRALRRAADIAESKPEEHAKSYATGLSVNITSPYPILWWLTAGLVLIDQLGPAGLVGFYSGLP